MQQIVDSCRSFRPQHIHNIIMSHNARTTFVDGLQTYTRHIITCNRVHVVHRSLVRWVVILG